MRQRLHVLFSNHLGVQNRISSSYHVACPSIDSSSPPSPSSGLSLPTKEKAFSFLVNQS